MQNLRSARTTNEVLTYFSAFFQIAYWLYRNVSSCALNLKSTPLSEGFIKVQECKMYVPHSQRGFITQPCYDKQQLHGLCSFNAGSIPNLPKRLVFPEAKLPPVGGPQECIGEVLHHCRCFLNTPRPLTIWVEGFKLHTHSHAHTCVVYASMEHSLHAPITFYI